MSLLPLARAVVIDSNTGTGNTNSPADLAAWANIGILGAGSGIYLGNGWVLTASQTGAGPISLGGISYDPLSGSTLQLTNGVNGKSTYTDLIMFRLDSTPVGLASLALATSPPTSGTPVMMVGAGRDRGVFTEWNVDSSTTPWTWTEVLSGGNAAGYQTSEGRTMRWGTNAITYSDFWVNVSGDGGSLDVKSFATGFEAVYGPDEAQAVFGDFGGAVFTKSGSSWELAGVMFSVAGYSGQPAADLTPVYGNETFSAEIPFYAAQIMPLIPEPSTSLLLLLAAAALGGHALRRRGSRV